MKTPFFPFAISSTLCFHTLVLHFSALSFWCLTLFFWCRTLFFWCRNVPDSFVPLLSHKGCRGRCSRRRISISTGSRSESLTQSIDHNEEKHQITHPARSSPLDLTRPHSVRFPGGLVNLASPQAPKHLNIRLRCCSVGKMANTTMLGPASRYSIQFFQHLAAQIFNSKNTLILLLLLVTNTIHRLTHYSKALKHTSYRSASTLSNHRCVGYTTWTPEERKGRRASS